MLLHKGFVLSKGPDSTFPPSLELYSTQKTGREKDSVNEEEIKTEKRGAKDDIDLSY